MIVADSLLFFFPRQWCLEEPLWPSFCWLCCWDHCPCLLFVCLRSRKHFSWRGRQVSSGFYVPLPKSSSPGHLLLVSPSKTLFPGLLQWELLVQRNQTKDAPNQWLPGHREGNSHCLPDCGRQLGLFVWLSETRPQAQWNCFLLFSWSWRSGNQCFKNSWGDTKFMLNLAWAAESSKGLRTRENFLPGHSGVV